MNTLKFKNLTDFLFLLPQVPPNFRFVVEQTLREFFKAIQGGKDTEQSWKKSIYKVISRMDDPVPEYFKSPNFLEQLE
jgi:prospero homeobox 1